MGYLVENIRRGQILECAFGNYKVIGQNEDGTEIFDGKHFDSRIPHEMRKLRPVVVVGEHKGQILVVPISSTEDTHNHPRKTGEARGFHIRLRGDEIPPTHFYDPKPRWAKANMVQAVDRNRLSTIHCRRVNRYLPLQVTPDLMRQIQFGVVRSIGLSELIPGPERQLAAQPSAD